MKGIERRLKAIEAAQAGGDWRASAWILEHCHPQHFSRNRIEVTGADGGPLTGAVLTLAWPHQIEPHEKILEASEHRLAIAAPDAG